MSSGTRACAHPGDVEGSSAGLPVAPHRKAAWIHSWTFPLIATRKDYRRYRKRYASFVNTVRQAMMETVVLLLGFSGEDPNFRQWLKWVRKNMGNSAPRIYLAGWLCLSKSRRKKLREKNVVPIDLARHPNATTWPEPLLHAKAVEWILLSLEHGRPYPPEDWPSHVAPSRRKVPSDLEPVQQVAVRRPKDEPWPEGLGEPHEPAYLEKIGDLLHMWRHNRECYPSWLVMPFGAAQEVRVNTDHWRPLILAALPHFADGLKRLGALSELVWRLEAQLDPLFKDLEKDLEKACGESS